MYTNMYVNNEHVNGGVHKKEHEHVHEHGHSQLEMYTNMSRTCQEHAHVTPGDFYS